MTVMQNNNGITVDNPRVCFQPCNFPEFVEHLRNLTGFAYFGDDFSITGHNNLMTL